VIPVALLLLLLLLLLLGPLPCLTWLPCPRVAVVVGGRTRARGSPAPVFCRVSCRRWPWRLLPRWPPVEHEACGRRGHGHVGLVLADDHAVHVRVIRQNSLVKNLFINLANRSPAQYATVPPSPRKGGRRTKPFQIMLPSPLSLSPPFFHLHTITTKSLSLSLSSGF
jgi:hypothetical protein